MIAIAASGRQRLKVVQARDPQDLAQRQAQAVAAELSVAVQARGKAVLAVSGGRSPVALFQALRSCNLPWSQVTVTLVDDRQVPEHHPASNARLVREHLCLGPAAELHLQTLVGADPGCAHWTQAQWQAQAGRASEALIKLGPADVVLFGMGADGHIASLFPNTSVLPRALDPKGEDACVAVQLDPLPQEAGFHRLSQTLSHWLRSPRWMLSVSGAEKMAVLEQALNGQGPEWPVSALLQALGPPMTLWISP